MRLPGTLALLGLAAVLLFGCGGSGGSSTSGPSGGRMPRAAIGPGMARMRASWMSNRACRHPHGASRWSCSVGPYRCQAVVAGRGWSVDCAKRGQSIPFTVRPRK